MTPSTATTVAHRGAVPRTGRGRRRAHHAGRGYDIIVLANMSPPAAEQVAGRIRRLLGATN